MPELPEVELHARRLRLWTTGRRLVEVCILDPRLQEPSWAGAAAVDFEALAGRGITGIERLAKYLFLHLAGGASLLIHLRMTGRLRLMAAGDPPGPHTRALLVLDDGAALHFDDPRRFGRLQAVATEALRSLPALTALGPDALDRPVDAAGLAAAGRFSRRPIKALLMDQRVLSGLGNICACEILFRCSLHPATPAASLDAAACELLAAAIPDHLRWAIAAQESREFVYLGERGAENVFSVYRRTGEPCPRCRTPILRARLAGRGTWWCPRCQPVSLSDLSNC